MFDQGQISKTSLFFKSCKEKTYLKLNVSQSKIRIHVGNWLDFLKIEINAGEATKKGLNPAAKCSHPLMQFKLYRPTVIYKKSQTARNNHGHIHLVDLYAL